MPDPASQVASASTSSDHPSAITWAALLARWMELARAAVSLPRDELGERWRGSIVPVIELQAIAMALAEVGTLPLEERAVARDRAAVGIRRAAATLAATWRGAEIPTAIDELERDALAALERSAWAGARELRWRGPGVLVMPPLPGLDEVLAGADRRGSLWVAPPGTPLMPGAPMAWWAGREDPPTHLAAEPARPWSGCEACGVATPRQLYRVLDEQGRAVEDLLVPLSAPLAAGLPLLVPLLDQGRRAGEFPSDPAKWAAMHRAALPEGHLLPLREWTGDESR